MPNIEVNSLLFTKNQGFNDILVQTNQLPIYNYYKCLSCEKPMSVANNLNQGEPQLSSNKIVLIPLNIDEQPMRMFGCKKKVYVWL